MEWVNTDMETTQHDKKKNTQNKNYKEEINRKCTNTFLKHLKLKKKGIEWQIETDN